MKRGQPVSRVLQIHTRYRRAGGEDGVVEAERQLLEGAGIQVSQEIFDNADLDEGGSPTGDLRLAASAIWSRWAQRRVADAIARDRPHLMHVHNTFAAASPSVYAAAAASGVPVVQTLHNYRFVCPAATAFRGGAACTDCVGKLVPWPAVRHACVRGSRSQSAVASATLATHRLRGTFSHGIGRYLALTEFQRALLVSGGLPPERTVVIPNFLEPDPGVGSEARAGILYVGRLSPEKGVDALVRAAARVPGRLRVVGDGPLAPAVERAAMAGSLDYVGPLSPAGVIREIRCAIAVVIPSVWFEGFPMIILEAFATGTPVIASRLGSLEELVDEGRTGYLVEPNDDTGLAERMQWMLDRPAAASRMGGNARERYEAAFRGPTHLAALLETYASLVDAPAAPGR